ncbi:MAG: DUF2029 domain-containing protein [Pseudolabrys sp.]|nr:DUF2029 domain-containing protein [Pseudolabrys sp.]
MAGLVTILRSGAWLTRERVRLIAGGIAIASLAGLIVLLATADGLNDRLGRPLGTDFSNVYAAGTYVLDGDPAKPFDPPAQQAREQAIFGAGTPFYGWHYPPFFLALAALLATMPYLLALAVWQGVTLVAYLWVIRGILNRHPLPAEVMRLWPLLALAFPAVFINLGHGHNGFLTAALFGGALLVLDRRPVLAGILFGLLAYKPQFGVLIPLALIASGRWRATASAAVTVIVMTIITTLAFGIDIWAAFLASGRFTRTVVLEAGDTGWHKIQTVFAWARMWGAPVPLAYALQAIVAVGAAIAVIRVWRGGASFADKAAVLLIGTLLATPYSLDYDLMLLAPALAFLVSDMMRCGAEASAEPWEASLLAALWLMPLVARTLAQVTLIPLAVPIMIATLLFVLRRTRRERLPLATAQRPA